MHVLRCIYYGHKTIVVKRLQRKSWDWMLDLNIIWDRMSLLPEQLLPFHKRQCNSATGQKIRRPGSSPMSWMALESPEMPDKFREHTAEKVERERPIYTISPNGDITVSQSWILGFHPATEEEMLACDDRREQNAMGDILYEGPLRPAQSRRQPGATAPPTRGRRLSPRPPSSSTPPSRRRSRQPQLTSISQSITRPGYRPPPKP